MEIIEFFDNSSSNDYERKIFYSFIPTLSEISIDKTKVGKYFILFVACDFNTYSFDELDFFAKKMLESDVIFVCTFGRDCAKMHDIFDENIVHREVIENKKMPNVMTTWHSKDTLDEALWFALFTAFPSDEFADKYESTLILAVENEDWNKQILSKLSNLKRFHELVLKETDNRQLATNN